MSFRGSSVLLCVVALAACASDGADEPLRAELEPGEVLPGGAATNTLLLGVNAFNQPAAGLSRDDERAFFTGNSFFNQSWVQAPSSTMQRDGLGPTFNARSCSGCHSQDGRGQPPDDDPDALGLLLRLSVPGEGEYGDALGVPGYGGQLQEHGIDAVPGEGRVVIEHEAIHGEYGDGQAYELRKPIYRIEEPAFGVLPDDVRVSPRVGQQVIGLGLLEAISDARLAALEDEHDADGDGISGRRNLVWDVEAGEPRTGRFGWKAEQPSVRQQVAAAFLGDIGITSRLFTDQNCLGAQSACMASASGGEPEIRDDLFDKVVLYSRVLAVPGRRGADEPEVLRGKLLFAEAGCDGCHVPSHETGESDVSVLGEQRIWPYTDLLLHDMGEALSDERPSFVAEGAEWRTPPLWGVGLIRDVNRHERLLHDGRARGVAEAVLWHGGEAEAAKESFRTLPAADREALIAFVESL